jgi:Protein of unknown function (DUF1592)/Protein of unknown function (DUF1588)/Protein of unknown function (DUF1595)/Protein of unknown function (DUF1585)
MTILGFRNGVYVSLCLVAFFGGACSGSVSGDGDPNEAGGGGSTRKGGSGGTQSQGGSDGTSEAMCDGTIAVPTTTSRLTATQYANSITALARVAPSKLSALPNSVALAGSLFSNNIDSLEISLDLVNRLGGNAEAAASGLSVLSLAPCTAIDVPAREACGTTFLKTFGARAFRRPLDAAELQRYQGFFNASYKSYGYDTAVKLTARAFLQSPQFVYLIEESVPAADGAFGLTPHALASRLSYTLTQNPPDAELLAAAESNALASDDQIRAHAERLLTKDKAGAAVADFFHGWLHIRKPDLGRKQQVDSTVMADQIDSIPESLERFADYSFWESGATVESLFKGNRAFVNPALAKLWGVDVAGASWTAVDLDPERFSGGLLTQPSFLAQFDPPKILHRGLFVARNLLCATPPAPPANITADLGDANSQTLGRPMTDRERMVMIHEKGDCAGCHSAIDPPGFALEHYDELGRWRDKDSGQPIDPSGTLSWDSDVDGPFKDGFELSEKLSRSTTVQSCLASQWFRFAHGRPDVPDDPGDICALQTLRKGLVASQGDIRALVLDLVSTPSFRTRTWHVERPQ